MLFLFIASGCFLVDGIPSTELQQMSAIVKKLEAKIDRQEAVNIELHSKNEALRRDVSELAERMESKANSTEEALKAIRETEHLRDSAVRDLPYIMMCAHQDHWTSTGIIPYDELSLDYSNCDRPGKTLLKQCILTST